MSRVDKIDEGYYAKDNNPSFYQIKKKDYHFYDDKDRVYKIASKNRQVLQNTRFKPRGMRKNIDEKVMEPVFDRYNCAKLYVKLTNPLSPWFVRSELNKQLVLYYRAHENGRSRTKIVVELKRHEKSNEKRRTGEVFVKGLDKTALLHLLNQ